LIATVIHLPNNSQGKEKYLHSVSGRIILASLIFSGRTLNPQRSQLRPKRKAWLKDYFTMSNSYKGCQKARNWSLLL